MAKTNVKLPLADGNFLLPVSPVFLGELLREARELGARFRAIYAAISADMDRAGMAKKQLRCEQRAWKERGIPALPGLDAAVAGSPKAGPLQGGRPAHGTDSGLILRLLERLRRSGDDLIKFGLPAFREFRTGEWLATLGRLDFPINVAKTNRERKKLYRRYLSVSAKLISRLGEEAGLVCGLPQTALLDPIRRMRLDRLWQRTISDLTDACHIHARCEERVLEGRKLKGSHRVLSTADRAASWIAKGDRVPVVGYKPQIARSPNGLVTAMLVPEGNAAAAAMLMPLAREAIANTGVSPRIASFDDGYTSAANLKNLNELGIADVSFTGPRGSNWSARKPTTARPSRKPGATARPSNR